MRAEIRQAQAQAEADYRRRQATVLAYLARLEEESERRSAEIVTRANWLKVEARGRMNQTLATCAPRVVSVKTIYSLGAPRQVLVGGDPYAAEAARLRFEQECAQIDRACGMALQELDAGVGYQVDHLVAENGDIRGWDNDGDGRPEPVYVKGYFRADGTYVRSHFRARPRPH